MIINVMTNPESVMEDTWGHVAPKTGKVYTGWILFAPSAYGDNVVIDAEFHELPDSPWFFQDMQQFVGDTCIELERGTLHKFRGTYKRRKNSPGKFSGEITEMLAYPAYRQRTGNE